MQIEDFLLKIKHGTSIIEYNGKSIVIKTAFLNKMKVGDLIEYVKQKK